MFFNDINNKKLKPKNAIAIFLAKLNKTVFTLEQLFNYTSFKDSFYSLEIFQDELGIEHFNISDGEFETDEQSWTLSVNFLLLIASNIIKNKPETLESTVTEKVNGVYVSISALKAAVQIVEATEVLAPNLGYRLQKHSTNEVLTLVPTETKEWMEALNLEDEMKSLIIEYYSHSGSLPNKRSILRGLWLSWEPIRKEYEKSFKGTGSDISRIMNKYGIRHADDSGIPNDIREDEKLIELHYDHLFNQLMQALKHIEKLETKN